MNTMKVFYLSETTMNEVWKDIPNYEGYYQASNLGRIRSLLFQNNVWNKKYIRTEPKILKPKISKDRCCRVSLWKDGKEQTCLVHRLVASTFLGNHFNEKITGTIIYPSSLSEGSKLIGQNQGYLSSKLKASKCENERYKWELI